VIVMKKIDKKLADELSLLSKMKDEDINTDDLPEITDFSGVDVGRFYRPIKKQITLRIDADLIEWFKQEGKGYQTKMNDALRTFVNEHKNVH